MQYAQLDSQAELNALFTRSSAHDFPDALPNHTLLANRYEVGRVLGQGGFACTYLAWDREAREIVVIKELFPSYYVQRGNKPRRLVTLKRDQDRALWDDIQKRFIQEIGLLRACGQVQRQSSHLDMRVVRLRHDFAANQTHYYVMNHEAGETLENWLLRRALNTTDILNLLNPVWETVHILHSMDILHRDIKPDNIIVRQDQTGKARAVLIDFGAARPEFSQKNRSIIQIHTPGYAPPEQVEAHSRQAQNGGTDVYAAAMTTLCALTQLAPPTDSSPSPAMLAAYRTQIRHRLTQLAVPESWQIALLNGISENNETRSATMRAWLDGILAAQKADLPVRIAVDANAWLSQQYALRRLAVLAACAENFDFPLLMREIDQFFAEKIDPKAETTEEATMLHDSQMTAGSEEWFAQISQQIESINLAPCDDLSQVKDQPAYQRAQTQDPQHMSAWAYLCDKGRARDGIPQNTAAAVYWYWRAAQMGYAPAMKNLAWSYQQGRGVAENGEFAAYWYAQAADLGNASAMASLAWLYDLGKGVAENPEKAVVWFSKAAEHGEVKAMSRLADCYEKGRGVVVNMALAQHWHQKAAENGNVYSQKWINKNNLI